MNKEPFVQRDPNVPVIILPGSSTLSSDLRASVDSPDDLVEVRSRFNNNRSFFRSVSNRLRIAALMSRAKRAENVTDINAEPFVDESIPLDNVKRANRRESSATGDENRNTDLTNRLQRAKSTKKSLRKTQQPQAEMTDPVQSATRNYYCGNGTIQFWKNFAFETEVKHNNHKKKTKLNFLETKSFC